MLIQYLVGLCCLRGDPNAVDITIGDMVFDQAADKERDVDVTVTFVDSNNATTAFKAYEVKREGTPLDVAEVEGLCLKFTDMPRITHKAIVSSSGFTNGARSKATKHGVDLYTLEAWSSPLESDFPSFGIAGIPEAALLFTRSLLVWNDYTVNIVTPGGPPSFTVEADDPILTSTGAAHPRHPRFGDYQEELLLRSTEVLHKMDPALTVFRTFPPDLKAWVSHGPGWPHTHTLTISENEAFLRLAGRLLRIETITINGFLQWTYSRERPDFYIMRRVADEVAFAGALVAPGKREGEMFAFTISNSETAGVHLIQLKEKHLNVVRRLKLDLPPVTPVPLPEGEATQ